MVRYESILKNSLNVKHDNDMIYSPNIHFGFILIKLENLKFENLNSLIQKLTIGNNLQVFVIKNSTVFFKFSEKYKNFENILLFFQEIIEKLTNLPNNTNVLIFYELI